MTFEEFTYFAERYSVVPVSKSMLADTHTPVSLYLRLRTAGESSFLFESVEGGERIARYSFIGRDPRLVISCRDGVTAIGENGETKRLTGNFLDHLGEIAARYRQPSLPDLPRFTGGLVGFIGYDAVRFIEEVPLHGGGNGSPGDKSPESVLGLFSTVIAIDRLRHRIIIIANCFVDRARDLASQYKASLAAIDRVCAELEAPQPAAPEQGFSTGNDAITSEVSSADYCSMVSRAKEYIREGDIFQVVLSQRFSTGYKGDLFNVYRALRIVNPSPYLYYLEFGGFTVIGSSPEILVRVEGASAEVYPIAGTRPRGTSEQEDARLEQDLLADEKERAEHVMLVDLGRNDLGRVCETGSVHVDRLMFVVRYSHVMHIASRVVGKVRPGASCIDVLKATFPAGTVSGAPKIRAMEIISELEHSRRGLYAGGVGYIDFSGNMDMCIAIRTMYALDGTLYLRAGAGIVADSVPEREFEETINKSRALVEALHMAEGIKH